MTTGPHEPAARPAARWWVRPLVAVGAMASLAAVFHLSGLRAEIDVDALRRTVDAAGVGAPVLYLALTVLGIAVGIPGFVFVLGGLVAFGGGLGSGLALLGATAGCVVAVWWIQRVGGAPLRETKNPWLRRALDLLERRPVLGVALLRLFVLMSPPGNAGLAFAGVRPWDNARGTMLGLLPAIAVATLATHWLLDVLQQVA